MGGRKDLITAGLTLGALAGAAEKAKGKMSAIIATESGSAVSFTAADAAPVADLTAAIVPVQSGSGDPSPTNIRPISGWTECKVYRSGADTSDPTIYTVTFGDAGTVYGGTLDVTTGTLTVDMAMVDLGTLTWFYSSEFNVYYSDLRRYAGQQEAKSKFDAVCSIYPFVGNYSLLVDKSCGYIYEKAIAVRDSAYADVASFKTAMSGVQVCYELAEPIVYNLSPVEIRTLTGQNTIWADTGDVTVKYTADTKAFIDKYIAERRNG